MPEKNPPANENSPLGDAAKARVPVNENNPAFAEDLLLGANAIAEFMFGDAGMRRRVFYLTATSRLPIFRVGSRLCARKSVLLSWIEAQEARRA